MYNFAVTGASGFIGGHVAQLLIDQGHKVILLVRSDSGQIKNLAAQGAFLHYCDLNVPQTFATALEGVECLFHLAAQNTTDAQERQQVLSSTFGLTRSVLSTAHAAGVPKVIYTSSSVVLGRSRSPFHLRNENDRVQKPESPYVEGKLLAETWAQEFATKQQWDVRHMYPSWVVGPGDPGTTPPHKFIKDFVVKGQPFYFGGGVSIASVVEVAKAHVNACFFGQPNGKYVLGGTNVTFQQLYASLASLYGKSTPKICCPKPVIYLAACLSRIMLGAASPVSPAYVNSVVNTFSWYSSSIAQNDLNYKILSLNEILLSVKPDLLQRLNGTYFLQLPALPLAPNQLDSLQQKPLLITGFPGWLGNRFVELLAKQFAEDPDSARKVHLLVQPSHKQSLPSLPANFKIFIGDISNPESLAQALDGIETIYHLAGVIYPHDLSLFEKINAQGTSNLADAAVRAGVRRFLFMSTDSTVGFSRDGKLFDHSTPDSPYKAYGKSKWKAEQYLRTLHAEGRLDLTIIRGFWFFGPHAPARNQGFVKMFEWPLQIMFGNGKNLRSISHLDDIIQAFTKAEHKSATYGQTYWLPSLGKAQSTLQIYRMISEGLGRKLNLIYLPNFACECFALLDAILTRLGIMNQTIHAIGKFHKSIAGTADAARHDFGFEQLVGETQIQMEIKESLKLG